MYKIDVVGGKYHDSIALCDSMFAVDDWINEHWDNASDYWVSNGKYTMEYRDILDLRYR